MLVRNPVNVHQVSKVHLNPEVVDGIVFWTKNPIPMLGRLQMLQEYMYYFQFTLNAYGGDVEPDIPRKNDVIIPAFQRLSDQIGPERMIWRYDPIFLNEKYTMEYHIRYFEEIAKRLCKYTRKCTISFLDYYRNTALNLSKLNLQVFTTWKRERLAKSLAEIAHSYGLMIDTCAEKIELGKYGIHHARCIDDRLLGRLLACPLHAEKDRNQRLKCGCAESLDIGTYNTCKSGCRYCYAQYNAKTACANAGKHDPESPLLIGELGPGDRITERNMHSCRDVQLRMDSG